MRRASQLTPPHRYETLTPRIARGFFHALTILMGFVGLGCTLDPADGMHVSYASEPVTFYGYSSVANGRVKLEAQNSAGEFEYIGFAKADSFNVNTGGTIPLYTYSRKLVVPQSFWSSVPKAGGGSEFRATVRMRIENLTTRTFTAAAKSCAVAMYQASTVKDLVAIGRQCGTGETMSITATVLFPARRLLGKTDCAAGAVDCNPCANDVRGQMKALYAKYRSLTNEALPSFSWSYYSDQAYLPAPRTGALDALAHHVQGFTPTYSSKYPIAGVVGGPQTEDGSGRGTAFLVNGSSQLSALVKTGSGHPTGMSVIGQYVTFADAEKLKFIKVDDATNTQNLAFVPVMPYDGNEDAPDGEGADEGISTGGGGVGITKLHSGKYLLVVHTSGNNKYRESWAMKNGVLVPFVSEEEAKVPRFTRFWELTGSLTEPERLASSYLGETEITHEHAFGRRRFSENLSVITECRTGDIYVVNVTGNQATDELDRNGNPLPKDNAYFLLSQVLTGPLGDVRLTPVDVFPKIEDPKTCSLRAAGGAFVNANHGIELYCSEYSPDPAPGRKDDVGFSRLGL